MAKFVQVTLLAFLIVAMVVPHEALFYRYKHKHAYPKHYVAKSYRYVPIVHQPIYYKAVPVYKKKFYFKKKYYG